MRVEVYKKEKGFPPLLRIRVGNVYVVFNSYRIVGYDVLLRFKDNEIGKVHFNTEKSLNLFLKEIKDLRIL